MSLTLRTKRFRAAFAPKTPVKKDPIRLSAEDQKKLVEEILNPPEPTPSYLRAREAYVRLIKKAC
jgi:hypothetical protein